MANQRELLTRRDGLSDEVSYSGYGGVVALVQFVTYALQKIPFRTFRSVIDPDDRPAGFG